MLEAFIVPQAQQRSNRLLQGYVSLYIVLGEWPKDFYIILEGEVSILIPKDQKVLNADKEANKALSKEI